mgnify:CR=1 FL=1
MLESQKIDVTRARGRGREDLPGGTDGSWGDMSRAGAVSVELNVLATFQPQGPARPSRSTPFVLLGNASPESPAGGPRDRLRGPKFVMLDTMNLWISTQRAALLRLLRRGRRGVHQLRGGAPARGDDERRDGGPPHPRHLGAKDPDREAGRARGHPRHARRSVLRAVVPDGPGRRSDRAPATSFAGSALRATSPVSGEKDAIRKAIATLWFGDGVVRRWEVRLPKDPVA